MINKGNLKEALNELALDQNNAVAHLYENAKTNSGVLENAVFTIKDNYATNDSFTTASSMLLRNFCAGYDAEVIEKLKASGASIVAKTNLDELGLGGTGEHSAFGRINHPLDKNRMPGGSSSGAAATFTENISIALGSDTGDSVRLPASYSGHVGFKPSYGAVSRYGLAPFASSLDTVSWFSHNVNDSIEVAKVLYGKSSNDFSTMEVEVPVSTETKPKTITMFNMDSVLSEKIANDYKELKNTFEKDGIKVNLIDIDEELFNLIGITYSVISYSEAFSNNANLNGISFGDRKGSENWEEIISSTRTDGFGEMVKRRFVLGSYFLLPENQERYFKKAQKVRKALSNYFEEILKDSILVYPTAPIAPLWNDGKADNWYSDLLAYSNLIGNPSISIPWEKENELPVNISVDSKIYDDKNMLSSALYIEKLIGGKNE